MKRLRSVIYGQSGVGKSTAVETAPGPRLILDSEGGSDWLEKPTIEWTDVNQAPPKEGPEGAGRDYNVVLFIRDWATFEMAERWLQAGDHNFRTVALDSLTDIQKRVKDSITTGAFDQQAWGVLLNKMDVSLRRIRDLTKHKTNPLHCIIITALVRTNAAGMLAPRIQGGLVDELAGLFDLVGFMRPAATVNDKGELDRELAIDPSREYEAKARGSLGRTLHEVYGGTIVNPNFTQIMKVVNRKPAETPETKEASDG